LKIHILKSEITCAYETTNVLPTFKQKLNNLIIFYSVF
jgi:hypothetical protein